jgi:hypothetical protein
MIQMSDEKLKIELLRDLKEEMEKANGIRST